VGVEVHESRCDHAAGCIHDFGSRASERITDRLHDAVGYQHIGDRVVSRSRIDDPPAAHDDLAHALTSPVSAPSIR
jgi:hypothetical protein